MGMGSGAIQFCWTAGEAKRQPQAYKDKRLSLLEDGFAMLSFAWVCGQACSRWSAPLSPSQLINRFGFCVALGLPYSNKVKQHASLRAGWWFWKLLFSTRWGFWSHINSLEMRMVFQALCWRARDPAHFGHRWLRLADSMVCNYILSKGRTSSKMLQSLARQIAVLQLAMNGRQLHGHVNSHENPTDVASRA